MMWLYDGHISFYTENHSSIEASLHKNKMYHVFSFSGMNYLYVAERTIAIFYTYILTNYELEQFNKSLFAKKFGSKQKTEN